MCITHVLRAVHEAAEERRHPSTSRLASRWSARHLSTSRMLSEMVCAGGRHSHKSMSGGSRPGPTTRIQPLAELTFADRAMTVQASTHADDYGLRVFALHIVTVPMHKWPRCSGMHNRFSLGRHGRPWSRLNPWQRCDLWAIGHSCRTILSSELFTLSPPL